MFRQGRRFNEGFKNMCMEAYDNFPTDVSINQSLYSPVAGDADVFARLLDGDINNIRGSSTAITNINSMINTINANITIYKQAYIALAGQIIENGAVNADTPTHAIVTAPGNGGIYYINRFGFKFKFQDSDTADAWVAGTGCDDTLNDIRSNIISNDLFDRYLDGGYEIRAGSPCDIAGQFVKDSSRSGFVDVKGWLHEFSDQPSGSCDIAKTNAGEKTLEDAEFTALHTGEEYGPNDECNQINVSSDIILKLKDYKSIIAGQIATLSTDIGGLNTQDATILAKLQDIQSKIRTNSNILNADDSVLDGQIPYNVQLSNQLTDSELKVTSSYTKYIIWTIVCFTILAITYYTFLSDNSSILVYIVISLLVLYVVYNEIIPRIQNIKYIGNDI
jgi:hypothetical protein